MYRIGEFSELAQVSVKALRHYDAMGIVRPARVDRSTAYRYCVADGCHVYFLNDRPDFRHWTIAVVEWTGSKWSQPRVVPFSGRWGPRVRGAALPRAARDHARVRRPGRVTAVLDAGGRSRVARRRVR